MLTGVGEPQRAVRARRDAGRSRLKERRRGDRVGVFADRSVGLDAPDLRAVGLGEPQRTVRTGGDVLRPGERLRHREVRLGTAGGHAHDLVIVRAGRPQIAVGAGDDGVHRPVDVVASDRVPGYDAADRDLVDRLVQELLIGEPQVSVGSRGDAPRIRSEGVLGVGNHELGERPARRDAPDLAGVLGEPHVAVRPLHEILRLRADRRNRVLGDLRHRRERAGERLHRRVRRYGGRDRCDRAVAADPAAVVGQRRCRVGRPVQGGGRHRRRARGIAVGDDDRVVVDARTDDRVAVGVERRDEDLDGRSRVHRRVRVVEADAQRRDDAVEGHRDGVRRAFDDSDDRRPDVGPTASAQGRGVGRGQVIGWVKRVSSRGLLERLQPLDFGRAFGMHRIPHVDELLHVQPHRDGWAEDALEPERHVGRNRALALDRLVQPRRRDAEMLCELELRDAERFEEVEPEDLAGRRRPALRGRNIHVPDSAPFRGQAESSDSQRSRYRPHRRPSNGSRFGTSWSAQHVPIGDRSRRAVAVRDRAVAGGVRREGRERLAGVGLLDRAGHDDRGAAGGHRHRTVVGRVGERDRHRDEVPARRVGQRSAEGRGVDRGAAADDPVRELAGAQRERVQASLERRPRSVHRHRNRPAGRCALRCVQRHGRTEVLRQRRFVDDAAEAAAHRARRDVARDAECRGLRSRRAGRIGRADADRPSAGARQRDGERERRVVVYLAACRVIRVGSGRRHGRLRLGDDVEEDVLIELRASVVVEVPFVRLDLGLRDVDGRRFDAARAGRIRHAAQPSQALGRSRTGGAGTPVRSGLSRRAQDVPRDVGAGDPAERERRAGRHRDRQGLIRDGTLHARALNRTSAVRWRRRNRAATAPASATTSRKHERREHNSDNAFHEPLQLTNYGLDVACACGWVFSFASSVSAAATIWVADSR